MHEWSIAQSLLRQASEICRAEGASRLAEVRVQIGPLSGIEAALLQSAFNQLVREHGDSSTRLEIESTPLVVRCRDCDKESDLADFDFQCSLCHGRNVQVVRGDEMLLVSISVDDDESAIEKVT